jgi:hypothetical protein
LYYGLLVSFGTNLCMSKHDEAVLKVLSKGEIKSTNQVLKELESITKKTINWHALYRILMDLEVKGKVSKLKAKAGFFWKKV